MKVAANNRTASRPPLGINRAKPGTHTRIKNYLRPSKAAGRRRLLTYPLVVVLVGRHQGVTWFGHLRAYPLHRLPDHLVQFPLWRTVGVIEVHLARPDHHPAHWIGGSQLV